MISKEDVEQKDLNNSKSEKGLGLIVKIIMSQVRVSWVCSQPWLLTAASYQRQNPGGNR